MLARRLRGTIGRRAAQRAEIERQADELMLFLGDMAYAEARERARACRARGDRPGDRHWGQAAVLIAKRTGHEIGVKAADRYGADARRNGRPRTDSPFATRRAPTSP